MILPRPFVPALALVLVCLVASACSAAPAATPDPEPEPTAAATEPPTDEAAGTPAETAGDGTETVEDPWQANALEHRGQDGEQFDYACPAGGTADTVWGTDVYTDDSSVCTAAVHMGVITLEEGGEVTIEIRPGEDSYEESDRNGIETSSYPAWGGSFVVIDD